MVKQHVPSVPKSVIRVIGEMISTARKSKGWRQSDLAERLGVSRQTVARMEHGDPYVATGILITSAWLLDVPIFPGMRARDLETKTMLGQLLELLKKTQPQRASSPKKKPIDDNF